MTKKTIIIITIIVIIVIGSGFGIYNAFFNINNIPTGELIEHFNSPNGDYTINAYLVSSALSSDAVRCELVNNETKDSRNIYWGYKEYTADVVWTNNDTVIINGRELNIHTDTYDWRR